MQTTKQILRAPFLGRQNDGISVSHGNEVNRRPPSGATLHIERPVVKTYTSSELFGAGGELAIAHRGERYTLRITSLGKLILTK